MNLDLEGLRRWLQANKLREPEFFIEQEPIKQVFESKVLGVVVDHHLSWDANTDKICKKITSGIWSYKTVEGFC